MPAAKAAACSRSASSAGSSTSSPFGAIMNKGMTVRGAQQHGHRYIPMILERIAAGEISTEHLATHVMPLDQGPQGYQMFKNKQDGCVRAVFQPTGATSTPS